MKRDEKIKQEVDKIVTELMGRYITNLEVRNHKNISEYQSKMNRYMQKEFSKHYQHLKAEIHKEIRGIEQLNQFRDEMKEMSSLFSLIKIEHDRINKRMESLETRVQSNNLGVQNVYYEFKKVQDLLGVDNVTKLKAKLEHVQEIIKDLADSWAE